MKMVTYKVLSKAMRELTGQVAELDEAIEIRLVFGEKLKSPFRWTGQQWMQHGPQNSLSIWQRRRSS